MFQSNNKKFSNIKNIDSQNNFTSHSKGISQQEPQTHENCNQPYVPHEDYDYTKIFNASYLTCPFGIRPQNAFPMKPEWQSTAEKEPTPVKFSNFEVPFSN